VARFGFGHAQDRVLLGADSFNLRPTHKNVTKYTNRQQTRRAQTRPCQGQKKTLPITETQVQKKMYTLK
jgi:hypothetical protein